MTNRSVLAVIVLTLITFGIYHLYWYIATKEEMNAQGANIPTGWLLIVPIANIYWMWKWSEGVEYVTRGKSSAATSFLLIFLLGVIGMAILQATFNNTPGQRENLPQARIA
jgi:FtsH-binding integral membrane protein